MHANWHLPDELTRQQRRELRRSAELTRGAGAAQHRAMANRANALIAAPGLKPPHVLGWPTGSMIAPAVVALHTNQVRRLVLCASHPGNGQALRRSQQAVDAYPGRNPQK